MDVNVNNANAALQQNAPARNVPADRSARPTPVNNKMAESPADRISAPERPKEGARINAPRISEMRPSAQRDEDITDSMLDSAFNDANRVLSGGAFRLSYGIHEASGRVMVSVHNVDTDEVIRELPPESRLDIYARITEFTGLLFDQGS